MPKVETTIKDAAEGKGVFTLVQRGPKSFIHYNLPQGYILFAVKNDNSLAMEVNNHLADVLETEHGNATRQALVDFAVSKGGNSDPEALIEQVIHEVAYERVKHSYLFNVLENDAVDRKADELAAKIGALVEQWITDEVSQAADDHTPDEGESHPAFECESRGCVKLKS
jgi:hypothetical protein